MMSATIRNSSNNGTAFPPAGRQPSMTEWLARPRRGLLARLFEVKRQEREVVE